MKKMERIYALYKGDTFICDGTIPEIHERTGKTIRFLKFMTCPIYVKRCEKTGSKNRLVMVALDD